MDHPPGVEAGRQGPGEEKPDQPSLAPHRHAAGCATRPRLRKLWSRMNRREGVPTIATASNGRAGGRDRGVEATEREPERPHPPVADPEVLAQPGHVPRLPPPEGEGPARVAVSPHVQGDHVGQVERVVPRGARCSAAVAVGEDAGDHEDRAIVAAECSV